MIYYNAIVYWSYRSVTRYNNITSPRDFVGYMISTNQHFSITKIFWYRKNLRKDKKGNYCGIWFPDKGFTFSI